MSIKSSTSCSSGKRELYSVFARFIRELIAAAVEAKDNPPTQYWPTFVPVGIWLSMYT